eukprot:gene42115-biopygen5005
MSQEALHSTLPPRSHKPGFRSPFKDGFSPTCVAHKHHLNALIEIRRHLSGEAHRALWSSDQTYAQGIQRITNTWEQQVLKTLKQRNPDSINPYTIMEITRHGPQTLRTLPRSTFINNQLHELKQRLHGAERTALRIQINVRTKLREEARQAGQIKHVIKSILGQHDPHNDLSTLKIVTPNNNHTHTILTDPRDIYNHLNTEHQTIFDIPPHHTPSPLQQSDVDWQRALTDRHYFNQINAHHNIPPLSSTPYGLVKRTAYEALSELWETHTIPDDWSWRYLCLKPKTTKPHLTATNLRPLTLIDCLRKLWGKIILHRINHQWHTHHTLSPLQHCQKRRGTDSALLQRAATAEAAEEASFNLYTSSWDFRKAFDSVSASLSPATWAAHMDILLRSLELIAPNTNPLIPGPPSTLTLSQDKCYADDLLSATATIPHLQTKADLVSAFALIFGLDIATNKLRLHAQIWEPNTNIPNPLPTLTLRGPQWTPIPIPIEHSTSRQTLHLKYLGPTIDLNNSSDTLLQELSTYINKTTNRILSRRATTQTKLTVLQSAVFGRLRYFMPHLTNSHEDLVTHLDKPIERFYRKLTKNMSSYPTRLLYTPRTSGGLGLWRPTDILLTSKLSAKHRYTTRTSPIQNALNGLILRHQRLQESTSPSRPAPSSTHNLPSYSATGPAVSMSMEAHLTWHSAYAPTLNNPPSYPSLNNPRSPTQRGKVSTTSLPPPQGPILPTIHPDSPHLNALAEIIGIHHHNNDTHLAAHIWTVQGTTRIGGHCTRTHHGQHTAAGGHSILLRQLLPQLQQPIPTFLIYREPNQPHRGTIYHITHKQITHYHTHQPHQPPIPNWIHQVTSIQPPPSDTFPIFQPIDLRHTEAFTDGSYATTNHDVHSIFYTRPQNDPHPPTTLATASILLSPTGPKPWTTHRLIGIRISNGTDIEATSAYPMEAIAITATLQLYAHLQHPNGRITTDCLFLQKRIQHLRYTQKNSSTAYHTILHAATLYTATTPTTIHWQKAHPEHG